MSSRLLICILIICQIYFSYNNKSILPSLDILPQVPTEENLKFQSMGDTQFLFRIKALEIQNAGDSFGRFTALKNYNYKELKEWLLLLDKLDSQSNFLPSLASYYYSNTQNVKDNRYLIEYLDKNFDYNPNKKWWWMVQAVSLARFKLQDKDLALKLALKLDQVKVPRPKWTYTLAAMIYAEQGEEVLAYKIITDLKENFDNYTSQEIDNIKYFIRQRLATKP